MKLILFFSFLGLLSVSSFAGTKPSVNPTKKEVVPKQKDTKGFWGFVSWAKGEKDKEILDLKDEVSRLKNQISILNKDKSASLSKNSSCEKDRNICRFIRVSKEDHMRSLKNILGKKEEFTSKLQAQIHINKIENNALKALLEEDDNASKVLLGDENYALKQEMAFNQEIMESQKNHIEDLLDQQMATTKSRKIKSIHTNKNAFAVLRRDGTVVTWGEALKGGDSSRVQEKLKDVKTIYSTLNAFAALKNDGSVVTWGDALTGGDSHRIGSALNDVKDIFSTDAAFAALKSDGSVVTWGRPNSGGDSDHLRAILKNVKTILSNKKSFAAFKNDDSIIVWGDREKDE